MMMCPRPHSLLLRGRPPPWSPCHACSVHGPGGSEHAGWGAALVVVEAALLQEVAG